MSDYELAENIHEPLSEYKSKFKELHDRNVKEYFDSLVEKSEVDVEANKDTNKLIKKCDNEIALLEKLVSKSRMYKVFLILLAVIFLFATVISIVLMTNTGFDWIKTLVAVVGVVGTIGFILILVKKLNPKIKNTNDLLAKEKAKRNKLIQEAYKQLNPLNNLFTEGISVNLFTKTAPLIKFDAMFDSRRLDYFVNKYGLDSHTDNNSSTLYIKSGEINGNPFYITRDLIHVLGNKTYSGSLVVSYRTTRTINGKTQTVTRTQTLTAHVTKPCPYFSEHIYLVYGNEAAPDLTFTRRETDVEELSEKQIDKKVKKGTKKLEKSARKSVSKGGQLTILGNTEFDVLFGAVDRDHEVQFRLLFTPLAQKQLLKLMKETEYGYGDEFDFEKHKKINYIFPKHAKGFEINVAPSYYYGYNIEDMRKKFVDYNNEFFRQIYFTFAPLLAIPLYQQQKPQEYIYQDLYDSYNSFYEHEKVVNLMNATEFIHPLSQTRNILKTQVTNSAQNTDTVKVTSYGYQMIPRVEYVRKTASDGRSHNVPVEWVEYIPVSQESEVAINYPETKEESPADRIKNLLERVKNKEISEKEMYRLGAVIAYIVNKNK